MIWDGSLLLLKGLAGIGSPADLHQAFPLVAWKPLNVDAILPMNSNAPKAGQKADNRHVRLRITALREMGHEVSNAFNDDVMAALTMKGPPWRVGRRETGWLNGLGRS